MQMLDSRSPENNYKLNVEQLQDELLRENMMALINMGHSNYDANMNILSEHEGKDIEDIIEIIEDAYNRINELD
jgi:hypothetical protein